MVRSFPYPLSAYTLAGGTAQATLARSCDPATCLLSLLAHASVYTEQLCTNNAYRTGVVCILLGFALGIANIFHFNLLILFSIMLL